MSDQFSWGTGVDDRENFLYGNNIHNVPPEVGSGSWTKGSGNAIFTGSAGPGNGTLTMNGTNAIIKVPVNAPTSGVHALSASGVFTPGTSGTRTFSMGLQTGTPDQNLLINQLSDNIYASINQAGTITLGYHIAGAGAAVTGSITPPTGQQIDMVLTLQPGPKLATLKVTSGVMGLATELSLTWSGSNANWNNYAINVTANSSLVLGEAAYDILPHLPLLFPKNMSFRAREKLNPANPPKVVDSLEMALNYSLHHAGPAQASELKSNDPGALVVKILDWTPTTTQTGYFSPAHVAQHTGCNLTTTLNTTSATVYVADATRFRVQDHVVIYKRISGVPDWNNYEYCYVTAVGTGNLTVERAAFNSSAKSFTAYQAIVAPLVVWTRADTNPRKGNWLPNYSLHCPTVAGKQGWEFFANWTATDLLTPVNGVVVDGGEHDVFPNNNNTNASGRGMDCNLDLQEDWGYFDGYNSFALGILKYSRLLRHLAGPDKIIQFDSGTPRAGYRGWEYANGVQMESFMGFDRTSEAVEHLSHWNSHARAYPPFSYAYSRPKTEEYGGDTGMDWKFRTHFALGLMVGTPIPYGSQLPDNTSWFGLFDWDEMHDGKKNNWQWLGTASGAASRQLPGGANLFSGATYTLVKDAAYTATLTGDPNNGYCIDVTGTPSNVKPNYNAADLKVWTSTPLTTGNEYTLVFDAKGEDTWTVGGDVFKHYPRLVNIIMHGGGPMGVLADNAWRTYTMSFTATNENITTCQARFGCGETKGKTWIKNVKLYAGSADRWSRTFENGKVFVNRSKDPWLVTGLPATTYWRLNGTITPLINNGTAVGTSLTIPANDAVFLRKGNPN